MAADWLRCGEAGAIQHSSLEGCPAKPLAPEPMTKKEKGKDKKDDDWFNEEWHRPALTAARLRRQNKEEWRPSLPSSRLVFRVLKIEICPPTVRWRPSRPERPRKMETGPTSLRSRPSSTERPRKMETGPTSLRSRPSSTERPAKMDTSPTS